MAISARPKTGQAFLEAAVLAATVFAAWAGTFLLLWMGCRFLTEDLTVSVIVAGIGVVTLSPLLGVITRPTDVIRPRHHG